MRGGTRTANPPKAFQSSARVLTDNHAMKKTNQTTMTDTLHIRVGEKEQTRQETREWIAAVERGEDVAPHRVLNIEREEDVARILSAVNLELLRTIAEKEPSSIRETAEFVGRDVKDVHGNLSKLETLNLIEFEQEGRSKRPVVPYDDIQLDIDLSGGHEGSRNHALA